MQYFQYFSCLKRTFYLSLRSENLITYLYMKILKRILLAIIIIPLVLLVAVMLLAAPIGKKYVNTHGEELVGRKLQLDGFTFNYMTGCASLDDLTVFEQNGDSVFMTIEDLDLNLSVLELLKGNLEIESLEIDDAKMNVVQDGTKFNFDDIVEFFATEEASPEYKIGHLDLDDCEITYTDMTEPSVPFSYNIHDLDLEADNFTTVGHNHVDIKAKLSDKGKATVAYEGSMVDFDNITLSVDLKDIDLVAFSPMFVQMFGREVVSGTLNMESEIAIISRHLNAKNHLLIDEPKVKKVKGLDFKPEFRKVPLKTCLYFLTDKHGQCDLDIPVTGSLDDPKFSYRRLLGKAFGRFIVKVASSPFKKHFDEDE